MSEKVKAKVLDAEEPSIQEKEEIVQKNAGFDKESGVYKVDLSKPPVTEEQPKEETDAVQEQSTDEVPVQNEPKTSEEVVEEIRDEKPAGESNEDVRDTQEEIVLEEITDEQTSDDEAAVVADQEEEQVEQVEKTEVKEEIEYPENIQDLVKFMNETGGTLEDYVALNKDYEQFEDMSLLHEYYTRSKPHLSADEINFLIEDKFSYDEEIDEPKDIKRKKLAFKEEVAQAKNHLESQKSNYYKEIKAGSRLTPEQQKAMDFFNRYNKESAEQEKITRSQREVFDNKTKSFFNNQFKGFEYNVGDKRYRFNVKNVNEVKNTQSDINNFVKRFLNEKNEMNDAAGYHKSLFTAMNADAIANHFYEQGKADAIKESVKSAKNIKMDPRSSHQEIEVGGLKARIVSGDDSSGLKLKLKNY
ncbi:MAG: hypothetical protein O3A79_03855 [Candidatus Marinimicrobia bacterium]|nr:hypothetical protein [Candidatus Neomarinimicrobiota bacterium]